MLGVQFEVPQRTMPAEWAWLLKCAGVIDRYGHERSGGFAACAPQAGAVGGVHPDIGQNGLPLNANGRVCKSHIEHVRCSTVRAAAVNANVVY